ncbi:ankyrin-2-like [Haliotis rufescens]|uniref:ankyrin-2-like n=1 Tax=Haliotis rufescens TaxID=6454 RepID=UPI00201F4EC3|nr:ankyrin-2-like [Haliotis rufescens]
MVNTLGHLRAALSTSTISSGCWPFYSRIPFYMAGKPVFENIIDATRTLIQYEDARKHVSTFCERSALRMLKQKGSIFIKGKSGSGKSSLGLRLLAHMESETKRTPVVITSATQWNIIPKSGKEKYIVMLDDIFGSSSMVQTHVDRWLAKFNTMWPLIETGHLFIVLTSRPEIYDQCAKQVNKNILMKSITSITLDKDEFTLRVSEKIRFLKLYCGNSNFTKDDLQEIVEKSDPPLGFPQCCSFFASSRRARSNGKHFFLKPYEFIAQEIDILEESDPFGYFVLILVMMHNGRLGLYELDSIRESEDFCNAVHTLQNICKPSDMPSRINIRQKAESLCEVYLIHSNKHFQFCHQSIFDVLFLKMSQTDHSICMKICPAHLLVERVRTQNQQNLSSTNGILEIPSGSFGVLADRITALLLSDDCVHVLDHPSLRETCFVQFLFHKWCEADVISKLFKTTLNHVIKVEVLNPCREGQTISLFECDNLLSCMTLKGNTELVSLLLPVSETYLNPSMLQQVLACAIYGCNHQLYELLIAMGVQAHDDCFRAMCAIHKNEDMDMVQTVVFSPNVQYFKMSDFTDLFTLAVLNQNQQMAKSLLHPNPMHLPIYSECVEMLFIVLAQGYDSQSSRHELNDNSEEAYTSVVEELLRTGCKIDPESLLYCAASHATAAAMRCIFKVYPLVNVNKMHLEYTPLQKALLFGGVECLSLLLDHGAEISVTEMNSYNTTVFHMAAKAKRHSKQKLEIMFAKIGSDQRTEGLHKEAHTVLQQTTKRENGKEHTKDIQPHMRLAHLVNRMDITKETPLHKAAYTGNADSVKCLINAGARINAQDEFDMTPLHLAVMKDHTDCIMYLLAANASLGITEMYDSLPLAMSYGSSISTLKAIVSTVSKSFKDNRQLSGHLLTAVQNNELDKVKLLCDNGADVNSNFADGTLLHEAVEKSDIDMVMCLCEKGARVDAIDFEGYSVVHRAIKSEIEPVEKVMYLLDERHAPVNVQEGSHKRTALFSAVLAGNDEIVEILLERQFNHMHTGVHAYSVLHTLCLQRNYNGSVFKVLSKFDNQFLNIQTDEGETALHILARNNDAYGMKLLLERGADHSIQNNEGMTPLHVAALESVDCLQLLLHFKADRHTKDSKRRTVLHHSAKARNTRTLTLLLKSKSDLDSVDENGWTAVHWAAEYGRKDNIKLLLENGADLYTQDNHGRTALHVGCEGINSQTVELILQKMSNANILDERMRSPLHVAARRGCGDNVKLLLDKGANPFAKDVKGRIPLHLAVKTKDSICVKLLLFANSDVCAVDNNGDTPLHLVTKRSPSSSIELLLENGANSNIQNKNGNTALHLAVYRGINKCVKLLLGNGSDSSVQNYQGQTPLHLVSKRGNRECVQLLLQHGTNASLCDIKGRSPFH